MNHEHFNRLERMFHAAPIQDILIGAKLQVQKGRATYSLNISKDYFHAANALHGAIYFKLLDDSAYFAAASLEEEYFLLTKSYTIHFKRPVEIDRLMAVGEVTSVDENEITCKSKITNASGKVVAEGEGVFVKSKKRLKDQAGYL